MKLVIISVGKQHDEMYQEAIGYFCLKVTRYFPLEWIYLPHDVTKEKEGERLLSHIKKEDYVVLLDERGREMRSEFFAELLENRMIDSVRRVVFIIGGAYGVSHEVTERANYIWKLSALVFPHMLVRVILVEQLYRALSIIKGEKYHHQ
jgi:23S rRNA (pseudouridine1915-N3)-methyltransferase